MSEERTIRVKGVSLSSDSLGIVAVVFWVVVATHGPDAPGRHTLSGAIFCALGGPAYCQTGVPQKP